MIQISEFPAPLSPDVLSRVQPPKRLFILKFAEFVLKRGRLTEDNRIDSTLVRNCVSELRNYHVNSSDCIPTDHINVWPTDQRSPVCHEVRI